MARQAATALESIGVVGISVHDHGAAEVARFTLAREERARRLPELAAALGAAELVYLATCNRVEVIYRESPEATDATGATAPAGRDLRDRVCAVLLARETGPEEAERLLRRFTGESAVEHLFRVAAGLDSAQLGEREIQGQIRDALATAREAGSGGGLVEHLLGEALRVAREVHLRTQLGRGRVSLAEIACDFLLERVRRTPSPVALVGVTPMTRRCAEILLREGVPVLLVNRTVARAEALAAELAEHAERAEPKIAPELLGACQALDDFRLRPPRVEAVLTATASPVPLFDRAALERLAAHTASQEPPLVVDLAVPPDVDPEAARAAQVPRIGMDEVNGAAAAGREGRQSEAAAARRVVDEAVRGLRRRLAERALAPVITRIHQRYRETALEGLERLLARQGVAVDGAAREALERWAETLARRFAHLPTLGLRGLAAEHGLSAVRSFLAACDGSSFAELGEEVERLELPPEAPADGEHR